MFVFTRPSPPFFSEAFVSLNLSEGFISLIQAPISKGGSLALFEENFGLTDLIRQLFSKSLQ